MWLVLKKRLKGAEFFLQITFKYEILCPQKRNCSDICRTAQNVIIFDVHYIFYSNKTYKNDILCKGPARNMFFCFHIYIVLSKSNYSRYDLSYFCKGGGSDVS